jgi:hypothetical protein
MIDAAAASGERRLEPTLLASGRSAPTELGRARRQSAADGFLAMGGDLVYPNSLF